MLGQNISIYSLHKAKNRGPGPRVTALPYILSPDMFGCFAGRRWIHVDSSGDALPCAYMPLGFGNIKEKSLKEIWKEMSGYRWFREVLMPDEGSSFQGRAWRCYEQQDDLGVYC